MPILTRNECSNGHDLDIVGWYEIRDKRRGTVRRACKTCRRDQARRAMARARQHRAGTVVYPQSAVELDRFFAQIIRVGDCWIWTGSTQNKGYGTVTIRCVNVLAHVASYRIRNGAVPDGLELDHLCRTPLCVNPDHLEPVTHEENMRRSPLWVTKQERCGRNHDDWVQYPSGRQCRTCNRNRKAAARAAA